MARRSGHVGMFLAAALLLAVAACDSRRTDGGEPAIAVSSSYIECAVRDLLGAATPVMRLAEPGMCPGHFDLRPAQVRRMRACRILLRFSFQAALDRQLQTVDGLTVGAIAPGGGMCVPQTYIGVCRQTADALVKAGMLSADEAERRLQAIQERLATKAAALRESIVRAGLREAPVLASGHQAAFCRYLGLEVAAAISGSDSASVRQIDQALDLGRKKSCRLVIANRPEGTQLAESVAERLGAKLVVFDNFPDMSESQRDFDALIAENVRRLLAAAGS